MSGGYTPGPWIAQTHPEGVGPDAVYTTAGIKVAYCMAMFGRPHVKRDEWDANARLIAAAPELLEPVQDAIDILTVAIDLWNSVYPDEPDEVFTDLQDRFRDAIWKATGQ